MKICERTFFIHKSFLTIFQKNWLSCLSRFFFNLFFKKLPSESLLLVLFCRQGFRVKGFFVFLSFLKVQSFEVLLSSFLSQHNIVIIMRKIKNKTFHGVKENFSKQGRLFLVPWCGAGIIIINPI